MSYQSDPLSSFLQSISDAVNQVQAQQSSQSSQAPQPTATPRPSVSGAPGANAPSQQTAGNLFSTIFGDDPFLNASLAANKIVPPIDIYEDAKSYTLVVSLPGITKDTVTIDFNKDTNELSIKGTLPAFGEDDKLIYSERPSGQFQRTLHLPSSVSGTSVKAKVANGILSVEVPKIDASTPQNNVHRIQVDTGAPTKAAPAATSTAAPSKTA